MGWGGGRSGYCSVFTHYSVIIAILQYSGLCIVHSPLPLALWGPLLVLLGGIARPSRFVVLGALWRLGGLVGAGSFSLRSLDSLFSSNLFSSLWTFSIVLISNVLCCSL